MSTPITDVRTVERIKNSNEVFTPVESVDEILENIEKLREELFSDWSNTILEPTCGNGRFVTAILKRRFEYMEIQSGSPSVKFNPIKALKSIYAIDIHASNIEETRNNIKATIKEYAQEMGHSDYWRKRREERIDKILATNIVCGDSAKIMGDEKYHNYYDFDIDQPNPYEFSMDVKIEDRWPEKRQQELFENLVEF